MRRATTAATLLACLTLLAGCSASTPDVVATGPAATDAAAASSAAPDPAADPKTPLDGLSALQVWKKAKKDAAAAKSVHVAAKMLDGKSIIEIDLKLSEAGKATGTLTFSGDKITVRRLGKSLYFKADKGFWTTNADAATAKALADKWILVKKGFSADMEQFFQLTDMNFILDDALALDAAGQKGLTLAPGITIGSQQAAGLAENGATKADSQLLYVSAGDPTLPLNFVIGTDNTQFMKFRGWDQDFKVVAPAGAIDLAKSS